MILLMGTDNLLPYLSPAFSEDHFRAYKLQNDYDALELGR